MRTMFIFRLTVKVKSGKSVSETWLKSSIELQTVTSNTSVKVGGPCILIYDNDDDIVKY